MRSTVIPWPWVARPGPGGGLGSVPGLHPDVHHLSARLCGVAIFAALCPGGTLEGDGSLWSHLRHRFLRFALSESRPAAADRPLPADRVRRLLQRALPAA